jgi:sulfatase maturation enzyme AslB (radical SAM superfamily)
MQCSFCYAEANSKEGLMSIDSIKFLKNILPNYSFEHTVCTGGEPLLHFDLVKEVRNYFKHVTLFTNGALINEDVVKWGIDTHSDFYVSLDYEIEGFDGHKAGPVRDNLENLLVKYPEFKKLLTVSHCIEVGDVGKIPEARKKCKSFENDCRHVFNYVKTSKDVIREEDVEAEMDRIERGEVNFDASLFTRSRWIFNPTILGKFNICGNCDPQITINYNNDVYLCQMPASTGSDYTKICNIKDFTLEKYYELMNKSRRPEPCAEDCYLKWTCGGICWAQNKPGSLNCGRYKLLFPYFIYGLVNVEKIDLDDLLTYYEKADKSACQMKPEDYLVGSKKE